MQHSHRFPFSTVNPIASECFEDTWAFYLLEFKIRKLLHRHHEERWLRESDLAEGSETAYAVKETSIWIKSCWLATISLRCPIYRKHCDHEPRATATTAIGTVAPKVFAVWIVMTSGKMEMSKHAQ